MKTGEKILLVGFGAAIGAGIVWWWKNQAELVLTNNRTVETHGGSNVSTFGLRGPLKTILD